MLFRNFWPLYLAFRDVDVKIAYCHWVQPRLCEGSGGSALLSSSVWSPCYARLIFFFWQLPTFSYYAEMIDDEPAPILWTCHRCSELVGVVKPALVDAVLRGRTVSSLKRRFRETTCTLGPALS